MAKPRVARTEGIEAKKLVKRCHEVNIQSHSLPDHILRGLVWGLWGSPSPPDKKHRQCILHIVLPLINLTGWALIRIGALQPLSANRVPLYRSKRRKMGQHLNEEEKPIQMLVGAGESIPCLLELVGHGSGCTSPAVPRVLTWLLTVWKWVYKDGGCTRNTTLLGVAGVLKVLSIESLIIVEHYYS
ncbi:hypothetical protein BKA70DRAFT_326507 [Coprinopsis sp. MPI-PUGE-AT-0042]|nr:hypothetical protein BKA70DRAFT_326507 [Coprinopsis sp. MPI-PUGE-AT-0042]